MIDNISVVIDLGAATDWIGVVIALVALSVAIWAGTVASRSLNLHTFSALLNQISSDEASIDRGRVRKIKISKNKAENINTLKELVKAVRKEKDGENRKKGEAAERTIARLDRVGFFLIGNGKKLKMKPPIWLWTLVKDIWEKLGVWVEYRQTCEKDPDFYHKGYGLYFKKLEDYRKKHKL